jgi:branched-chain amino acid transport system substrate-binding protein
LRKSALSAVALLVLSTACAGIGRNPVIVGALYPTAGNLGEGGTEEYRGVHLAAELANEKGGIDGRPIELKLEAADSPDAAPEAVKRLKQAGAQVVVGSFSSVVSRPAAITASRNGMVFWESGAVGEVGMSPTIAARVFRVAPTGAMLGHNAVSFVRDQLIPKLGAVPGNLRYGVAYVDDVYGRSVGEGALDEIEKSGLTLSYRVGYDLAKVDYNRIAQELIDSHTDVLVVAAYLEDGVALRRAIVDKHVPLLTSIGTSSSYCHPAFGKALGLEAVGLFASDKADADIINPSKLSQQAGAELIRVRDLYRSRYGQPMSAAALSGFSAAWGLFRYVMPKAGDLSAGGIAAAASKVRLKLGSLPNGAGLAFERSPDLSPGVNERASSVIWEWVSPGVRAIVWPPAYATSPILAIPLR